MSDNDLFEWDEAKRLATMEKHGLDFHDASLVFSGNPLVLESTRGGEHRWLAIGMIADRYLAVAFTYRGAKIRIITARKAREYERRAYDAYDAGRDQENPQSD